MALDASERELIADVIGSVRTVAAQLVALHLQLGAIRSLLVKKGTISEAEYSAAVMALESTSAADAILSRDAPAVEEAFDELLRRLERLT
jgi:type II secretory pathway predicted ATPase ExeA